MDLFQLHAGCLFLSTLNATRHGTMSPSKINNLQGIESNECILLYTVGDVLAVLVYIPLKCQTIPVGCTPQVFGNTADKALVVVIDDSPE